MYAIPVNPTSSRLKKLPEWKDVQEKVFLLVRFKMEISIKKGNTSTY